MPVTDEVTKIIDELEEEEGQPIMVNEPTFEWNPGNLILDMDEVIDEDTINNIMYDDEAL